MKAIAPMVAVVLMLAFTIIIGGIISVWLSGLKTSELEDAPKQMVCREVNETVCDLIYDCYRCDPKCEWPPVAMRLQQPIERPGITCFEYCRDMITVTKTVCEEVVG